MKARAGHSTNICVPEASHPIILGGDAPMGPFLMWKSGGPTSTYIYHDSDKGNVKLISGSPADGEVVEGTRYDSTCVPALKFITPLCDTGCMLFCDVDDRRSEKEHMWEEY